MSVRLPNSAIYSGHSISSSICIQILISSIYNDWAQNTIIPFRFIILGTSSETQRKHFAVYINTVDENRSWYLDDNIGRYNDSTESPDDLKRRSNFIESNRKHSINGYIYGNIPPLSVCLNDDVYLHVASLGGNSNDVHSFTVLGHTLLHKNKR